MTLIKFFLGPLIVLSMVSQVLAATSTDTGTPDNTDGFVNWHFSLPTVTHYRDAGSASQNNDDSTNSNVNLTPLTPVQLGAQANRNVIPLAAPTSLWQRIRNGFDMSTVSGPLVESSEQWYEQRPDYIVRMVDRSKKYMFHIVEALEKRNMPTELALLPFVESAYNPHAVSPVDATGIWQIMPATGRDLDLVQNAFRDDRKNVWTSTSAALDYLQQLHAMFGSWDLALAAYNWGSGNVNRAITKNKKLGLPTNYASLNMPQETRQYLPRLQAIKNIVSSPAIFGTPLPEIGNHPYFESVNIQHDMDVSLIAKLAEISVGDFKSLNPALKRPVVLAEGDPTILLPWENSKIFQKNLVDYGDKNLSSWTVWVSPRTYSSAEIAKHFDMSEASFRDLNQIPPKMLVKAGSALLVPTKKSYTPNVSQWVADSAHVSLAPEISYRNIFVKPRKGETIIQLAHRYHLAPYKVAEWNHLSEKSRLKPGKEVLLKFPLSTVLAWEKADRVHAQKRLAQSKKTKEEWLAADKIKKTEKKKHQQERKTALHQR